MVAPLDKALFACQSAIKATTPKDPRGVELRAALLYEHALRFDSTENERRIILAQALMAIPTEQQVADQKFKAAKD
jgi:hypothetical protein